MHMLVTRESAVIGAVTCSLVIITALVLVASRKFKKLLLKNKLSEMKNVLRF